MRLTGFILIVLLSIISCKKSASPTYTGGWKLVKTEYTIGPRAGVFLPTADSVYTLELNADQHYYYAFNGATQYAGTFTIQSGDDHDIINETQTVPSAYTPNAQFIYFSSDSLILKDVLSNPGGSSKYFYLRSAMPLRP